MVNSDRYDENSGMVRKLKDYFESKGASNCEQSEWAKECLKLITISGRKLLFASRVRCMWPVENAKTIRLQQAWH